MFSVIKIGLFLINILGINAENWAVLVAGSNGYYNYRHQADVCHAYQIFHKNNFPDSNIIVMMYDDIANNKDNPYKGNIINRPDGENVYPGTSKDYTGDDVNPENFLNVLKGNITGTKGKKVLNSTENDNVFIYFTDHGGTNIVGFPNDYLYADQLNETLTYMYNNKMYNNLVFYLEACESGSMFSNILNDNMNIYATTASTPYESSYACYLDEKRNTYLGDCYSVHWLENSSPRNIFLETVEKQFLIDRQETNTSTVCAYGDQSVAKLSLIDFMFFNKSNIIINIENKLKSIEKTGISNSRMVKYNLLKRNFLINPNKKTMTKLSNEISSMEKYDNYFKKYKKINDMGCDSNYLVDNECLREKIKEFESKNGRFTDYGLQYVKYLAFDCKI